MLVEFLQDVTVQDKIGRQYKKGMIVEMPPDACKHWITRKKARFVNAPVYNQPVNLEFSEESKRRRRRRKQ